MKSREFMVQNRSSLHSQAGDIIAQEQSFLMLSITGLDTARFCAFDQLWVNGKELSSVPVIERKRRLRKIIPQRDPYLLYSAHAYLRRCFGMGAIRYAGCVGEEN